MRPSPLAAAPRCMFGREVSPNQREKAEVKWDLCPVIVRWSKRATALTAEQKPASLPSVTPFCDVSVCADLVDVPSSCLPEGALVECSSR
jgi:hypothetical protein